MASFNNVEEVKEEKKTFTKRNLFFFLCVFTVSGLIGYGSSTSTSAIMDLAVVPNYSQDYTMFSQSFVRGFNMVHLSVKTRDECYNLCTPDDTCDAFTYTANIGRCMTYTAPQIYRIARQSPGRTIEFYVRKLIAPSVGLKLIEDSALAGAPHVPSSTVPSEFIGYKDARGYGYSYLPGGAYVPSRTACTALCSSNSECLAFKYVVICSTILSSSNGCQNYCGLYKAYSGNSPRYADRLDILQARGQLSILQPNPNDFYIKKKVTFGSLVNNVKSAFYNPSGLDSSQLL